MKYRYLVVGDIIEGEDMYGLNMEYVIKKDAPIHIGKIYHSDYTRMKREVLSHQERLNRKYLKGD